MSFIFAGLILLNFIYLGIFMIFTVLIGSMFYRLLTRFILVTSPILQFRERSRILVIEFYIKILESMVAFRGAGNARVFEAAWMKHNNYYQTCHTHVGNHSMRWLGCRIAVINAIWLFVCLMLPFISLKFFPGIFFGEKSWKIPLGLTWSFKVVTLTSNLVT